MSREIVEILIEMGKHGDLTPELWDRLDAEIQLTYDRIEGVAEDIDKSTALGYSLYSTLRNCVEENRWLGWIDD